MANKDINGRPLDAGGKLLIWLILLPFKILKWLFIIVFTAIGIKKIASYFKR
jgi:hypothetical protein